MTVARDTAESQLVGRLRGIARNLRRSAVVVAGSVILTVGSLLMLIVAVATAFRARRFYAEQMAARLGRIALVLSGMRMRIHASRPFPSGQMIYISNHTSTLDVFAIIALALPNARFFMSGFLRQIPPLALIGYLIGLFWTVPYRYAEKRRRIFARAESVLRRTGESVFLTPEGSRIRSGEIGHFNRGAFHLATNLHAPIFPIFIDIPTDSDPGMGLVADPGTFDVYYLPPITTTDWSIDELDQNRERVRDLYVKFHDALKHSTPSEALRVAESLVSSI